MAKMFWKKKKTIAMYINRRQHNFDAEFTPTATSGIEILMENGNFLVRETSTANDLKYIITE
tara:strand:- start:246 stop:431 length:186 start_codon:yes stop_codon:yes gene_type:complete